MIIRSCQKVPQSPFEVGNGEAPVERLFEGPGEGIEATQGFGRVARAAEIGVDAVSEDRRATPSQTPAYLGPLRTRARKPFRVSGRFPALSGKDRQKAALVVLAGGLRTTDESLPPRERLGAASTQRVLTASRLWHEQGFGLIVLSGAPPAETAAMLDRSEEHTSELQSLRHLV